MPAKKKQPARKTSAERSLYQARFRYDLKGIILLGAVFFLLIFSVFNFIALMGIQYDIKNDLQTIKQGVVLRESALALLQEGYNEANAASFVHRESFGDNFSSFAYIDQSQTSLSLDEETAAFTFAPEFELEKAADCQQEACGLEVRANCVSPGCPALDDNQILVGSETIDLPQELAAQPILSFSAFPLSGGWLVGFVTPEGEGERGWVYRLSSDTYSFIPLITNDTKNQILPKYAKQGGTISFGGSDRDFLVVYGGYQMIAFQFKGDEVIDISRFLGLRVADGGFMPQITYQGQGDARRWYLCGNAQGRPKFIKLWTNGSGEVRGSRSLGSVLFPGVEGASLLCQADSNDSRSVDIALGRDGQWQLWSFSDQGFSNLLPEYQAQSINIFDHRGQVTAAVISDIGVCGQDGCGLEGDGEIFRLYLSNRGEEFTEVAAKENFLFENPGEELRIKAVFPSRDSIDYSPWYDHLNYLSYAWVER